MVELRERVEEDRGLLKKIQLHIPGFAGYRLREDIRAADSILRLQLAEKIGKARKELEACRAKLVENYTTENLEKLGGLISKFKTVEGEVRHAEQGYTGFSPAIRIEERELDRLYEFDYSMLNAVLGIEQNISPLRDATFSNDSLTVESEILKIKGLIEDFETSFKRRMKVITGTEV